MRARNWSLNPRPTKKSPVSRGIETSPSSRPLLEGDGHEFLGLAVEIALLNDRPLPHLGDPATGDRRHKTVSAGHVLIEDDDLAALDDLADRIDLARRDLTAIELGNGLAALVCPVERSAPDHVHDEHLLPAPR